MNHAIPNLQIHIHKVDGATTTFIQNDADEVKKILDGFEPTHIFDRDRFVITDGNSITSLPVAKITRIDLVSEHLPHLIFPVGIVDAVELAETEFQELIRNPAMREQWEEMTAQEDSLVTFLDLELADGQCLFLTTEMHIELQSEEPWASTGRFKLVFPYAQWRSGCAQSCQLDTADVFSKTDASIGRCLARRTILFDTTGQTFRRQSCGSVG